MKRRKEPDKLRQNVLLTLPAFSDMVVVSPWQHAYLFLSFFYFTGSNLKPVRRPAPESAHPLSRCCLGSASELRKDGSKGRWRRWVAFGVGGGSPSDLQSSSYLHLLRFARSDSHSLCAWRWEADLCEGMRIGKRERLVQKRPFHATQLPGSQSSGCQGKLHLFHSRPNGATRRRGPFRRQYPLTNAIWDDFPDPCVEASQPETTHFNHHFQKWLFIVMF